MKKKVMLIDDSDHAAKISEVLKSEGLEVFDCANLADAEDYLKGEYKYYFDALLLDLTMDYRDLPENLREEAKQTFSGWVFYQRILPTIDEFLYNNTILYTAYEDTLSQYIANGTIQPPDDFEKEKCVLRKDSVDLVSKAISMVDSFPLRDDSH